jgi:hypothetical protein
MVLQFTTINNSVNEGLNKYKAINLQYFLLIFMFLYGLLQIFYWLTNITNFAALKP